MSATPGELPQEGFLTLTEHLIELRRRLIYAALILFLGFCICFAFSEHIFNFVRHPIIPYLPKNPDGTPGGLVFLKVTDKFMAHLKLSFMAGTILTSPGWLYQVWAFIAPGLYQRERKFAGYFVFSGTLLFLIGAAFAYYLALPSAYEFLLAFGGLQDRPMITIEDHISFLTTIIVVFGLVFEMPLILTMLSLFGIISADFLSKNRRYAIVINSIVAAVVAPPDLMSMIFVLVPMVVLYEISILVIRAIGDKESAST